MIGDVYINIEGPRRPKWIAETPEQFASNVVKLSGNLIYLRVAKTKFRGEVMTNQLTDSNEINRKLESTFITMENY
jgi:hypothetical protein